MKLINTKADKKKHKKLSTICGLIIFFVMALFIGGGIFFAVWLELNAIVSIPIVIVCIIIGAVISFIVRGVFSNKFAKVQDSIEQDFQSNLAVCDCCGRYLSIKDYEWKDGALREGESVYNDSGNRTTSYTYSVSVSGKCPNCGKNKKTAIVENAGSTSSGLKHIAFTNKDESYHKDNRIRYDDKQLVQKRLREDANAAHLSLDKYLSMGYVVENASKSAKTNSKKEKTRVIYYSVCLDDAGQNVEAVAKVLERYFNSSQARHLAEVGGLIEDRCTKTLANNLIKALEEVGAKAHMEEEN